MENKKKRKRIEVLQPVIKTIGGGVDFKEILSFCEKRKFKYNLDCSHRFNIIEKQKKFWVGIVVTNQLRDLPPKEKIEQEISTGEFSSLGIDPQKERPAYPNIFLYDLEKNVILYEVNSNGCYIDRFIELIYDVWNENYKERRFDLEFVPVLRAESYERVLNLNFIKRIYLKIANPREISENIEMSNQSIAESIMKKHLELSDALNAEKLTVELDATTKRIGELGLNRGVVKDLLGVVGGYANKGYRKNVEKIQVYGYEYSSDNPNRLQPIDLFVDTFKEFISLQDVKLHKNIQQLERKEAIIKLHGKINRELSRLLS